jgi:ATP-dependent Clp protease ATP-binding subunit ClpA
MPDNEYDLHRAEEIAEKAVALASDKGHEYVTIEHMCYCVLADTEVVDTLHDANVEVADVLKDIESHLNNGDIPRGVKKPRRTKKVEEMISQAVGQVLFSERTVIRPIDLLLAIAKEDDDVPAAGFLRKHGLTYEDLKEKISENEEFSYGEHKAETEKEEAKKEHRSKAERVLAKFCENLNERAAAGKIDPLIGRQKELAELILTSARRSKSNSLLVGEPGVGKTAIVEGFALAIHEGNVPDIIKNAVVYSLSMGDLTAGTKLRGDMEERVKNIVDALEQLGEKTGVVPFLFIDEIHTMIGAGAASGGSLDVANIIKPALARGTLKCIGGTTYDEFRKHFEKDRALLRRFQKVDVEEPTVAETKLILRGIAAKYGEFHSVEYTEEALDAMVDLTHRYLTDKKLPDKAIDILDLTGAQDRVAEEKTGIVTLEMVQDAVSKVAKIPSQNVKESETDKLSHLANDLKSAVFGQDSAVDTVVTAIYKSKAGLREADKTVGSYLMVGPTGTGKSQISLQLAETLNVKLHRFDMSEYMEAHSIARLIGSPPGYVGYGDGAAGSGLLANAIETDPHCVLLIDEIEKSHNDVRNIFLSIMDKGMFTTSSGKEINCRNVILIMTSNAGALELEKNPMGFGQNSRDGFDDKIINKTFSPEFRNRLDAIVKFKSLTTEVMHQIVDKFIAELSKRASAKNVELELTGEARDYLATNGYDSKNGARPLKRLIEDKISADMSVKMLFGSLKNGGKAVIKVVDDNIVVEA